KSLDYHGTQKRTKIITVLSTRGKEGKTTVAKNIAKELISSGKSVLVLNHSEYMPLQTKSSKSAWMHRLFGYEDPRIDYSHPFLESIDDSLNASEYQLYNVDNSLRSVDNYSDLNFKSSLVNMNDLDYVIIELPNLLESNYPSKLLTKSDLALLVCRSNRLWSKADENVLNTIKEHLGAKLQFIVNGVDLKEVESVLGELPKNRTTFRRRVKNILRFQFYTNQHI
ncbi:MAG: AAA family ATPase, partial [Psychroserpens sp.]|nr:AAA family ATPase [Psychroserpens sp.]